ncbi:MAG TPA: CpsD/CapB family tyrosine-protein kinase [Polyangiaceae bacterium]|nr:CpsD/CapB family tyrosine-protein kinase [Polyangiaceae bacterium]
MQGFDESGPEGRVGPLAVRSEGLAAKDEEVVHVVPVWASPPDARRLVMLGDGSAEAAAALRVIRHRLEVRRAEGMWTLGVTSALDEEGKSTFAAQLALVLSEAQRARVLLVEASFRRPSLSRLLGLRVPPGLGFSGQIARRMRGVAEPWSVLALGPVMHALVESESETGFPAALHASAFGGAVESLGRAYDWVIVDAPSMLGSGDANVVEEAVDGMIVVARSRRSRGNDLHRAMKQLGMRKAIGVVLWDVR